VYPFVIMVSVLVNGRVPDAGLTVWYAPGGKLDTKIPTTSGEPDTNETVTVVDAC